jgi:hypothetical protein
LGWVRCRRCLLACSAPWPITSPCASAVRSATCTCTAPRPLRCGALLPCAAVPSYRALPRPYPAAPLRPLRARSAPPPHCALLPYAATPFPSRLHPCPPLYPASVSAHPPLPQPSHCRVPLPRPYSRPPSRLLHPSLLQDCAAAHPPRHRTVCLHRPPCGAAQSRLRAPVSASHYLRHLISRARFPAPTYTSRSHTRRVSPPPLPHHGRSSLPTPLRSRPLAAAPRQPRCFPPAAALTPRYPRSGSRPPRPIHVATRPCAGGSSLTHPHLLRLAPDRICRTSSCHRRPLPANAVPLLPASLRTTPPPAVLLLTTGHPPCSSAPPSVPTTASLSDTLSPDISSPCVTASV